ncbi:MAG TPA: precorrin-8X methylmutase [Candidatus Fimimorpha faecalis]|uniref:Precorrin-8X methylmutase n=1 Tax=Candidatus Fimimorpha faecalis TaxID=2840824 RepID=A0A9D1JDA4_9FIRM|nr:precorrin-8X methylmutase [Candidatus Fimimorpha faecalis]
MNMKQLSPQEIELLSFEIIERELGHELDPVLKPIIKRVIHTTADFSYVDTLTFSEHAVEKAIEALKNGASIVTDTNMAKAGINKNKLSELGGQVYCFMADEDVALEAKRRGITRAAVSMEKAAKMDQNVIFAIGNAPTALMRLYELIQEEKIKPELIIGVPVGFVHVVEAKELILKTEVPFIVARGRKGGSNVAAAICNALLYQIKKT